MFRQQAFAWVLLLFSPSLFAGHQQLRFERIGEDEELSGSPIRRVFQDSIGFIWIGTSEGLYKYDGYQLQLFKHEPLDINSPSSNEITQIIEDKQGFLWLIADEQINRFDPFHLKFERFLDEKGKPKIDSRPTNLLCDSKGQIWIGTNDKGLFRFDPANAGFVNYRYEPEQPNSLGRDRIHALYESKAGELWIGTDGGGLNKFDPLGNRFLRYFTNLQETGLGISIGYQSIAPSHAQSSITEDENGDLWFITTGSGLICFNPRKETHVQYLHRPDDPNSLANNIVVNLFRDSRGQFWLISKDILQVFDPKSQQFTESSAFFAPPEQALSLKLRFDAPFVEDPLGRIWIGTANSGLLVFDPYEKHFSVYTQDQNDRLSLGGSQVSALLLDRSNGLWIGTTLGGLNKYSPHKQKFTGFYAGSGDQALLNEGIDAFLRTREGQVWLGTTTGSLLKFDTNRGKVIAKFLPQPNKKNQLQGGKITRMLEDERGGIWVASLSGLLHFDPSTTLFESFGPLNTSHDPVYELALGLKGRIWIGMKGDTLRWKDPGKNLIESHSFAIPTGKRWNAAIVSIRPDSEGGVWVGHSGYGLHYWHPTGKGRLFLADPAIFGALSHANITSLCLDQQKNLWVATMGGGINLLRPNARHFEYFTQKSHALPTNLIYGLIEDEDHKIWVSMKSALGVFDPIHQKWRFYDIGDGLVPNNSSIHAFYKDERNHFYYGGIEGFNYFSPKALSHNPNQPHMAITLFSKMGESLFGELRQDQKIELNYTDTFFVLEFSALDFTYPAKNQYMYKLEGFDKGWVASGSRRSASYTNLMGGNYTFRVKGFNSDGVESLEEARVFIHIMPPFYRKTWFMLLLVGLGIALMLFAIFYQRRRLHYQQQEALLELDLRRKTEELESARQFQISMLPPSNLQLSGYQAVGKMRTATEVGGDYYDFLALPDGRQCLILGDATGHGFAAGLVVGMTKMTAAIWAANPNIGLCDMMCRLNLGLKRSLGGKRMGMGLGLTLLEPESGNCELAFSGMPFPLHYDAKQQTLDPLPMRGFPLGFLEKITIQTQQAQLHPGDSLILLSDGLSERFNCQNQLWQNQGMQEELRSICMAAQSAEQLAQAIIAASDQFAGSRTLEDDMTIVVLKRNPL